MKGHRRCVRAAEAPLLYLGAFIAFDLAYRLLGFPGPAEIIQTLQLWLEAYGLGVLFLSAFVETLFMIGFYFPGSFIIITAAVLGRSSVPYLCVLALTVWAGIFTATAVNYFLGFTGAYRALSRLKRKDVLADAQRWAVRRGVWALWIAAVHPNILALVIVNMGIGRAPTLQTLAYAGAGSLLAVACYTILVGGFVSLRLIETPHQDVYVIGAFVSWALIAILREWMRSRRAT